MTTTLATRELFCSYDTIFDPRRKYRFPDTNQHEHHQSLTPPMCNPLRVPCRGEAGHKPLAKDPANKTNKRQATLGVQLSNNVRARHAADEISSDDDESDLESARQQGLKYARERCLHSKAPTFLASAESLDPQLLPLKSAVRGNNKR